jgi:hypothetical protein
MKPFKGEVQIALVEIEEAATPTTQQGKCIFEKQEFSNALQGRGFYGTPAT